jgi:hypothetical protein
MPLEIFSHWHKHLLTHTLIRISESHPQQIIQNLEQLIESQRFSFLCVEEEGSFD